MQVPQAALVEAFGQKPMSWNINTTAAAVVEEPDEGHQSTPELVGGTDPGSKAERVICY